VVRPTQILAIRSPGQELFSLSFYAKLLKDAKSSSTIRTTHALYAIILRTSIILCTVSRNAN